ncbi:MAG: response regulator [Hydrocarboniphaga effusa]|nr:response regulator [Hydrocarboniphaga effusa]
MSQRDVLVVDDSPSARFAMRKYLERCRCVVTTANNGSEALDYLRAHRPLAVFLDQLMPGTSGLEVLRTLKSDPRMSAIPVVICTSVEAPEFRQEACASGALEVLQKPPRPERIQTLLDGIERAPAAIPSPLVPPNPPAPAPATPPAQPAGLPAAAEPYAALRGEINAHLRRLTEDIFVQMAELKMQLARPETDGLSSEEQETLRQIAREEADGLQNAVREEINAIRHRLDTMDYLQRKDREDMLRAVRATAAAEAVTVAEHTVNDVVTRLSHRISETVLKALGREK